MKTLKLLSLLLLMSTFIYAQEYVPIVETGYYYSVGHKGCDHSINSNYEIIGNDTIIDEIVYKKFFVTQHDIEYHPDMPKTLKGFVRETEDGKVYARSLSGEEGLIYDHNVNVGDTIDFFNPFMKTKSGLNDFYSMFDPSDTLIIIASVDYIEINGVNRKTYTYSGCTAPPLELYIEGLGSEFGIFYNGSIIYDFVGGISMILCAYKGDNIYYHNPNYDDCFIVTDVQELVEQEFSIYPNPAKDEIIIESNQDILNSKEYSILNQAGQTLSKGKILSNKIDISNLANGVYYLKIEGKVYKICKIG